MAVMIGIDPHKRSHTAVALDDIETPLGELWVRSAANRVERLVVWAASFVSGRGRSKAPAGSATSWPSSSLPPVSVVDVQPKLAARVRLLATASHGGEQQENDPNDARSVAVAALRSAVPEVSAEDHAAVMKVWAKRHRDLSRQHNRVACRLHSVRCDLVPGGIAGEISPVQAPDRSTGSNQSVRSPQPATSTPWSSSPTSSVSPPSVVKPVNASAPR